MTKRLKGFFGTPGTADSAAPFLKWAGGKGQLLGQLEPLLPDRFARYVEPFVGGGAMFFYLYNLGRIAAGALLNDANEAPPERSNTSGRVPAPGATALLVCPPEGIGAFGRAHALLNDANAELMTCYRVVRDAGQLPGLIERLREHAARVADADYYYRVRAWDREPGFAERYSPAERAARTIFLNHACYNGLYRLNRRGQFNVPHGKWSRPPGVFDEANLWACHRALQGVELLNEGFEACLERAAKGDFVYLDPPYDPLSATSSFTAYTGAEFRARDQERLAEAFRALDARGCRVLLSNSATPFIRRLYRGYAMTALLAARAISSKASGRGKIAELAIRNY